MMEEKEIIAVIKQLNKLKTEPEKKGFNGAGIWIRFSELPIAYLN